jgi:hypothetical protein
MNERIKVKRTNATPTKEIQKKQEKERVPTRQRRKKNKGQEAQRKRC